MTDIAELNTREDEYNNHLEDLRKCGSVDSIDMRIRVVEDP